MRRPTETPRPGLSLISLAVLFIGAGVMHFVLPRMYEEIVPPWVPNAPLAVVLSGIAEIAGGAGLLHVATRRAAAWGLIALLVAVFPANIRMLQLAQGSGASALSLVVLWVRLPLQVLLIWWVWRAALRR